MSNCSASNWRMQLAGHYQMLMERPNDVNGPVLAEEDSAIVQANIGVLTLLPDIILSAVVQSAVACFLAGYARGSGHPVSPQPKCTCEED